MRCQGWESGFYSKAASDSGATCDYSFGTPLVRGLHKESAAGEEDEMSGFELRYTSNEVCQEDGNKKFEYIINFLCDKDELAKYKA